MRETRPSRLFLGIDGGQSGTKVVIGDEHGSVIGSAAGGPCNHVSSEEAIAKFQRVIYDCVTAACVSAGLPRGNTQFASACCGMSGGPEDKRSALQSVISSRNLIIVNDAEIALAGAFCGGPGVVVIAGTGSIAYGRNAAGESSRAGGWGYIYGDEGSAFDLVRQAIRAALALEEGWGEDTLLRGALIEATGVGSANELLHAFYTPEWPRLRVAKLAVIVDRIAMGGDLLATRILKEAGEGLGELAGRLASRLFRGESSISISWIGGVFESAILLESFRSLVTKTHGLSVNAAAMSPAAGALLLAYRSQGLDYSKVAWQASKEATPA